MLSNLVTLSTTLPVRCCRQRRGNSSVLSSSTHNKWFRSLIFAGAASQVTRTALSDKPGQRPPSPAHKAGHIVQACLLGMAIGNLMKSKSCVWPLTLKAIWAWEASTDEAPWPYSCRFSSNSVSSKIMFVNANCISPWLVSCLACSKNLASPACCPFKTSWDRNSLHNMACDALPPSTCSAVCRTAIFSLAKAARWIASGVQLLHLPVPFLASTLLPADEGIKKSLVRFLPVLLAKRAWDLNFSIFFALTALFWAKQLQERGPAHSSTPATPTWPMASPKTRPLATIVVKLVGNINQTLKVHGSLIFWLWLFFFLFLLNLSCAPALWSVGGAAQKITLTILASQPGNPCLFWCQVWGEVFKRTSPATVVDHGKSLEKTLCKCQLQPIYLWAIGSPRRDLASGSAKTTCFTGMNLASGPLKKPLHTC